MTEHSEGSAQFRLNIQRKNNFETDVDKVVIFQNSVPFIVFQLLNKSYFSGV
jgi:hypothetical protein